MKTKQTKENRTVDGSHAMWSPSATDCLAEDWEVVE